jgi:hypothetical protein
VETTLLSKILFIVTVTLTLKGKNPIYFGVITIIPFDNLYRRAYFVMHTFLVQLCNGENESYFNEMMMMMMMSAL